MDVTIQNKTFDEISVGDSASLTRTLTRQDAEMFAVISGDYNPTHLNDEWAERLIKSEKISAHGMWGASLISALLGNELPGPGTVYRSQSLAFLSAVHLGDTLTVSVTVLEKRADTREVLLDCSAVNQDGVKVVSGEALVVAPAEKVEMALSDLPEIRVRRRHHVFENLIEKVSSLPPVRVAVCHPCDDVSLGGAIEAFHNGIIEPVLVGPAARVRAVAEEYGLKIDDVELVDTEHSHESAERAVSLCRAGNCEALMKGSLHTDEMMSEVTKRDTGLRTGRRLSHVFVMDVPTYPKTLFLTDAAINIYPELADKVDILQNAIDLAHVMGQQKPLVAILSAVETVYPKIKSTLEAAALCKMADRGQIKGALLDGPLAFDNAISPEAARIKKIESPVAGQADILLVPDLEAGNMLAKQMSYMAEADTAGIVLGARVPIILTSRADSTKGRLASCAVAAMYAQARRTGQQKLVTGKPASAAQ